MKKGLLALNIVIINALFSCTASKPIINNNEILNTHKAPYKIFGVGNWSPGYSVLTLTDADHQYFVIKVNNGDLLKVGDDYKP